MQQRSPPLVPPVLLCALLALPALTGIGGGATLAAQATPDPTPTGTTEQHVVVVVEEEADVQGRLHRFRRAADGWFREGDAIPVVVGRSGVGPKQEGDGRAPRGTFPLGTAFGYDADPPAGLALPYRPMLPGTVCVDDTRSPHYNRIMDSMGPDPEWESAEAMRRDLVHGDDLYELGVVVEYNADRTPGAGSCIFLHVWRDGESPTAGCTAMAEEDLRELLAWLDPGSSPVLIQGSRDYLEALRAEGALPHAVPDV